MSNQLLYRFLTMLRTWAIAWLVLFPAVAAADDGLCARLFGSASAQLRAEGDIVASERFVAWAIQRQSASDIGKLGPDGTPRSRTIDRGTIMRELQRKVRDRFGDPRKHADSAAQFLACWKERAAWGKQDGGANTPRTDARKTGVPEGMTVAAALQRLRSIPNAELCPKPEPFASLKAKLGEPVEPTAFASLKAKLGEPVEPTARCLNREKLRQDAIKAGVERDMRRLRTLQRRALGLPTDDGRLGALPTRSAWHYLKVPRRIR
jgi:hypothetical protein